MARLIPEATHAYVAFRACGHPVGLLVDDGWDSRGLAKDIAQLIADDCTVERVTIEEAREIGVAYCFCVPTVRADEIRQRQHKRELARTRRRRW